MFCNKLAAFQVVRTGRLLTQKEPGPTFQTIWCCCQAGSQVRLALMSDIDGRPAFTSLTKFMGLQELIFSSPQAVTTPGGGGQHACPITQHCCSRHVSNASPTLDKCCSPLSAAAACCCGPAGTCCVAATKPLTSNSTGDSAGSSKAPEFQAMVGLLSASPLLCSAGCVCGSPSCPPRSLIPLHL